MLELTFKRSVLAASLLLAAAVVQAGPKEDLQNECGLPATPSLPTASAADADTMAAAGEDVRAFVAATKTYLSCVDEKSNSYGSSVATRVYNDAVDLMKDVASQYNKEVRAFKKLNG
ncbi:MAG: hypothetical protein V2I63_01050 [Pseudomonadales bacterium]|jgi:hypothetical protein|nr:hypothetical protein [Pseudomonadales bacterium]